jgi:hypothetical protein
MYERGFAGALYSAEKKAEYRAMMPNPVAEDICHGLNYADSSAGKLVAAWAMVEEIYPGCWPAKAQTVGSCVAHAGRNQRLVTMCGEVVAGLPDPVSGKMYEAPSVSAAAQKDGVLAVAPHYRYRGSRGHGWYCQADQMVSVKKCGVALRRDYPGIADLTTLNEKWASAAWSESQLSSEEKDMFDDHMCTESTEISTFEALRDLLARGFGVTSCGSEGWSSDRDENGFSRRQGSWAHALAITGADDRPEVHRKYGGPLVLIQNSWSRWNKGGDAVLGTQLKIPPGSFWAKWTDCQRRDIYAINGLRGWERKLLPSLEMGWS